MWDLGGGETSAGLQAGSPLQQASLFPYSAPRTLPRTPNSLPPTLLPPPPTILTSGFPVLHRPGRTVGLPSLVAFLSWSLSLLSPIFWEPLFYVLPFCCCCLKWEDKSSSRYSILAGKWKQCFKKINIITKLPSPSILSYWREYRFDVRGEAAIMDYEVRGECSGRQETKTGGIWVPIQTLT